MIPFVMRCNIKKRPFILKNGQFCSLTSIEVSISTENEKKTQFEQKMKKDSISTENGRRPRKNCRFDEGKSYRFEVLK